MDQDPSTSSRPPSQSLWGLGMGTFGSGDFTNIINGSPHYFPPFLWRFFLSDIGPRFQHRHRVHVYSLDNEVLHETRRIPIPSSIPLPTPHIITSQEGTTEPSYPTSLPSSIFQDFLTTTPAFSLESECVTCLHQATLAFQSLESQVEMICKNLLVLLPSPTNPTMSSSSTSSLTKRELTLTKEEEYALRKYLIFMRYRNSESYHETVSMLGKKGSKDHPWVRFIPKGPVRRRAVLGGLTAFLESQPSSSSLSDSEPSSTPPSLEEEETQGWKQRPRLFADIEEHCWKPMMEEYNESEIMLGISSEAQEFIVTDKWFGNLDDVDPDGSNEGSYHLFFPLTPTVSIYLITTPKPTKPQLKFTSAESLSSPSSSIHTTFSLETPSLASSSRSTYEEPELEENFDEEVGGNEIQIQVDDIREPKFDAIQVRSSFKRAYDRFDDHGEDGSEHMHDRLPSPKRPRLHHTQDSAKSEQGVQVPSTGLSPWKTTKRKRVEDIWVEDEQGVLRKRRRIILEEECEAEAEGQEGALEEGSNMTSCVSSSLEGAEAESSSSTSYPTSPSYSDSDKKYSSMTQTHIPIEYDIEAVPDVHLRNAILLLQNTNMSGSSASSSPSSTYTFILFSSLPSIIQAITVTSSLTTPSSPSSSITGMSSESSTLLPLSLTTLRTKCRDKYIREGLIKTLVVGRSSPSPSSSTSTPSCEEEERGVQIVDLTDDIKVDEEGPVEYGSFADIWKGEWVEASRFGGKNGDRRGKEASAILSNKKVALKVLRQRMAVDVKEKLLRRLKNEVLTWCRLRHPHVASLYGIVQLPHTLAMVSPWCRNGTVMEYIRKHDEYRCETKERSTVDRLVLLVQIASGVSYLHDFIPVVIHGDLKGNNILIDDQGNALITDFGVSNVLDSQESTYSSSLAASFFGGATRWMAPELVKSLIEDNGIKPCLTKSSDVYAFASVCLEVMTGSVPYSHRTNTHAVTIDKMKGLKPCSPGSQIDLSSFGSGYDVIQEDFWKLMDRCWDDEWKMRPSMSEVMSSLVEMTKARDGRLEVSARREPRYAPVVHSSVRNAFLVGV
ncbi:hypothetical protein C8Q75DRAFT_805572 [Abortiporus biennis]|nr:hypothetical protein C8Q75DRAFT_805572 [Abortiporus biennis]